MFLKGMLEPCCVPSCLYSVSCLSWCKQAPWPHTHPPPHTHHVSLCCHRPRPVTMQYNQVTTRLLSPCHHVLKPSSFPCRWILSTVCDSDGHLSTTVCNVKCTLSLNEATLMSSFVLKTKCSDCHSVWKWSPNFSCSNGDSRTSDAIQSMIQGPPFENH